MPAEDDISIEEKRVYAGSTGRTDVYVASADGLVRVAVSGDKIGEFGLVAGVTARDVAVASRSGGPDVIAVATADDLLVGAIEEADDGLEPIGVGPTTAVGLPTPNRDGSGDGTNEAGTSARFLAATADGDVVSVSVDEATANRPGTLDIGSVDEPRAIDSGLVAAADGVHRVTAVDGPAAMGEGDGMIGGSGEGPIDDDGSERRAGLEHVGLRDARDVAGAGVPLAATDDGLYWLANGWMESIEAATSHVAADGDGHALAATTEGLFAHASTGWDRDAWEHRSLPMAGTVTALAYGPGIAIAVTDAGALCVDAGDGWRHQILGIREIGGIATHARE
ncbi:HVO_0234 family beta-propeller protein [Halopenitus persicus]|uniref:HVO_0234 family beta-propeller protein n=1 Tax=Halopenitus persicus TaxID=1048396 RepID=UPI000BBAB158|nr:hypothetical protein [Halopenitus persicus]